MPSHSTMLSCSVCGAPFPRRPSGTTYCSRTCKDIGRRKPLAERFWDHVDTNGPIPAHCPELGRCWLWTGNHDAKGYGYVTDDAGDTRRVSRVIWELAGRSIAPDTMSLHRCDNPPCVRLTHLFQGTALDNARDKMAKGRLRAAHGEARSDALLTEQIVREIRARCAAGETQRSVAERFGVSRSAVGSVMLGRSWRHVTP